MERGTWKDGVGFTKRTTGSYGAEGCSGLCSVWGCFPSLFRIESGSVFLTRQATQGPHRRKQATVFTGSPFLVTPVCCYWYKGTASDLWLKVELCTCAEGFEGERCQLGRLERLGSADRLLRSYCLTAVCACVRVCVLLVF